MAEGKKIVIEILDSSNNENDKPNSTLDPGNTKQSFFTSSKYLFVKDAVVKIAELAVQDVEVSFNRYTSLKEDYMLQNTVSNIKTGLNLAKSVGGTILSSTLAGATVGGPVGAVVGAAIGVATAGINLAISQQQRYSSYYQALNASNMNANFQQVRAGLYNNGAGTEN